MQQFKTGIRTTLVILLAATTSTVRAVSALPAKAEPRNLVLFMSTEIAVEKDKQVYPVKDVSGRSFVIDVDGKPTAIPMWDGKHGMKFKYELKVVGASASLTGLKTERTYMPGTDPRMIRQKEAALTAAVIGDNASLAQGKYLVALNHDFMPVDLNPKEGYGKAQTEAETASKLATYEQKANEAFQALEMAQNMMTSEMASGAAANLAAESDRNKGLFDALEVKFDVSSPVFLDHPFMVLITRFHAPNARDGKSQSSVFAKALEPFGSTPVKVEALQGGFPKGFEVEGVEVHLYDQGREVATDVAPKRVPLSRSEAFAFLLTDYLHNHKGATLPALPALGRLDKEERAHLTSVQFHATYFVKVAGDGHPLAVFTDEACSQPADENVVAVAQNVRFYPALEKGKAVDGVARMAFNWLRL